MHELSICHSIVSQAIAIAREHQAQSIAGISIAIGPLSGVDIHLLEQAFPFASAGTLAEDAILDAEPLPLRIRCSQCQHETTASPNKLVCPACGSWHTQVISGDEMLITRIELEAPEERLYV
ncbi:MAG: hydrogenase maturation nickel metallochaperone HypA [Gammaproteobacteria bacterium]|nr:MAG: hydrogenase maturation nickel metallochaperone HypA [Gammaproteobacteria bacterium]